MFSVVSRPGESLFYIRPRGSKQRQPVAMDSSSPLISCVVGRVSLIPPDSCHSPSQCTIVDSDTHWLPHKNAAAAKHTLSHLQKIASVKYIMPARSKRQRCFHSCHFDSLTLQVNPVQLPPYFLSVRKYSVTDKHFIIWRIQRYWKSSSYFLAPLNMGADPAFEKQCLRIYLTNSMWHCGMIFLRCSHLTGLRLGGMLDITNIQAFCVGSPVSFLFIAQQPTQDAHLLLE